MRRAVGQAADAGGRARTQRCQRPGRRGPADATSSPVGLRSIGRTPTSVIAAPSDRSQLALADATAAVAHFYVSNRRCTDDWVAQRPGGSDTFVTWPPSASATRLHAVPEHREPTTLATLTWSGASYGVGRPGSRGWSSPSWAAGPSATPLAARSRRGAGDRHGRGVGRLGRRRAGAGRHRRAGADRACGRSCRRVGGDRRHRGRGAPASDGARPRRAGHRRRRLRAAAAETGRVYVQASAYGDEHRFGLRPPLGYLAATVVSWVVWRGAPSSAPLRWAARVVARPSLAPAGRRRRRAGSSRGAGTSSAGAGWCPCRPGSWSTTRSCSPTR